MPKVKKNSVEKACKTAHIYEHMCVYVYVKSISNIICRLTLPFSAHSSNTCFHIFQSINFFLDKNIFLLLEAAESFSFFFTL